MKKYLYLITLIFFIGCEEKIEPRITISPELALPIMCMKLNKLDGNKKLIKSLKKFYTFDEHCALTLSLSSKKDIVCNSPQNALLKTSGKFPKSYLSLKLRKGMELKYSYYIDLYSNVDEDDVEEGFIQLKKDLIEPKI